MSAASSWKIWSGELEIWRGDAGAEIRTAGESASHRGGERMKDRCEKEYNVEEEHLPRTRPACSDTNWRGAEKAREFKFISIEYAM